MTTLDELIQGGWADHAEKTAEVADRLEEGLALVTDGKGAAGFMNLVNHAVGDHLGERERATRICEAVVAQLGADAGADAHVYLAVARHLAGDAEGAAEAERKAGIDPAGKVRVDMLVAQGRMHAGDWDAAAALYADTLARSGALPEGHAGERSTAVVSNNIASEALQLETRTDAQAALMKQAADAARTYWGRIGTWVNDMRSDYLLSLVHTALGQPAKGREHAERGLATIAANGEEKVDEAFLHLARARACRDAGDAGEQAASIEKAEALAAGFEEGWLTDWYGKELAKAR
jgi:hypothetical protein